MEISQFRIMNIHLKTIVNVNHKFIAIQEAMKTPISAQSISNIVQDCQLHLSSQTKPAKSIFLIGESQAGKSTILHYLMASTSKTYHPTQPIATNHLNQPTNKYIQPNNQDFHLNPELTNWFPQQMKIHDLNFYQCSSGFKEGQEDHFQISSSLFLQRLTRNLQEIQILMIIDEDCLSSEAKAKEFQKQVRKLSNKYGPLEAIKDGFLLMINKAKDAYSLKDYEELLMKILVLKHQNDEHVFTNEQQAFVSDLINQKNVLIFHKIKQKPQRQSSDQLLNQPNDQLLNQPLNQLQNANQNQPSCELISQPKESSENQSKESSKEPSKEPSKESSENQPNIQDQQSRIQFKNQPKDELKDQEDHQIENNNDVVTMLEKIKDTGHIKILAGIKCLMSEAALPAMKEYYTIFKKEYEGKLKSIVIEMERNFSTFAQYSTKPNKISPLIELIKSLDETIDELKDIKNATSKYISALNKYDSANHIFSEYGLNQDSQHFNLLRLAIIKDLEFMKLKNQIQLSQTQKEKIENQYAEFSAQYEGLESNYKDLEDRHFELQNKYYDLETNNQIQITEHKKRKDKYKILKIEFKKIEEEINIEAEEALKREFKLKQNIEELRAELKNMVEKVKNFEELNEKVEKELEIMTEQVKNHVERQNSLTQQLSKQVENGKQLLLRTDNYANEIQVNREILKQNEEQIAIHLLTIEDKQAESIYLLKELKQRDQQLAEKSTRIQRNHAELEIRQKKLNHQTDQIKMLNSVIYQGKTERQKLDITHSQLIKDFTALKKQQQLLTSKLEEANKQIKKLRAEAERLASAKMTTYSSKQTPKIQESSYQSYGCPHFLNGGTCYNCMR